MPQPLHSSEVLWFKNKLFELGGHHHDIPRKVSVKLVHLGDSRDVHLP